jgi:hypothetical protein
MRRLIATHGPRQVTDRRARDATGKVQLKIVSEIAQGVAQPSKRSIAEPELPSLSPR